MGQDIHIKVAKYNRKTNLYEQVKIYRKLTPDDYPYEDDENGFREICIGGGNRDYEAWDGMKDGDDNSGYGYFPWTSINYLSLEPSFAERIKKDEKLDGTFDFYEINLSEFKLYLKEHPEVTDYDAYWPEDWQHGDLVPKKENPIKYIFDDVESYLSVADKDYGWNPSSYYKVIFYFDW